MRLLVSALALTAVTAGCGGEPRAVQGSPASSTGAPATSAAPVSPPPARVVLTAADDGRTVAVGTSTRIALVLGDGHRWTTPTASGVAVDVQENVSDAPTGTQEWEVRPAGRGRAVLTTTGSPTCRSATPPCAAPDRTYTVTLDVTA